MLKPIIPLLFILCVFIPQANADDDTSLSDEALEFLKPTEKDIIIGNIDAPVTLVEYASMSCSHCAAFQKDIVPFLKENYIDSGKLKIVFRHYPLNPQALIGSMLLECLDNNKKREKFIKTMFKSLESWAYKRDFRVQLKKIAKIGGVGEKKFNACMDNKETEERILNGRLKGSEILGISSTPTIFLNGKKVKNRNKDAMKELIDSLL